MEIPDERTLRVKEKMVGNEKHKPIVFRPITWRAWFALSISIFLFSLWALVTIGVGVAPPPMAPGAKPADAGPGVVLAIILWPGAFLCGHIGLGILRSRVVIHQNELEFTLRRFVIWSPLQRVRHLRLPWSEVRGVQVVEQSNPHAPDFVQRDYVIHTSQGQFAVNNLNWPHAAEIAEILATRIGRIVGDLEASADRVDVNQPRHRLGLNLMHGCGLAAMILFGVVLLSYGVIALRGDSRAESAMVITLGVIGFGGGATLWRWGMKS